MDFWTIYRMLIRRKWAVIAATVMTIGAAMLAYSRLPAYYEATVTMMPSDRVLMHPTSVGAVTMPPNQEQRDERVSTLVAMAQSRTICSIAVRKLDCPVTVPQLHSKLSVDRIVDNQNGRQTNMLRLRVVMDRPEDAVAAANSVAASFCGFYDRISHREAIENRKFLEEQLRDARRKLDIADQSLREFRGRAGVTKLDTQVEADLRVLSELKSERDGAAARLSELTGNLAAVSTQLAGMSITKKTIQMTSEGSATADLEMKIADMEKELSLLRSRYTPRHPKVVQLETTLARARNELAKSSDRMISKVTVASNPEYESLLAKRRELEAERAAQSAKLAALDRTVGVRQTELLRYSTTDVDLSRRLLDSANAQEAYSSILAQWSQARIDESLTTETGAIQIIDSADKAKGPLRKGPNRIQLLIASALFGLALGVGYCLATERLDIAIRTIDDAKSLIELPIVGVIPRLDSAVAESDMPKLTDLNPISPYAESYRFLSSDLLLSAEQSGMKSIMVATAKPHQGGTVTISNLAITLAQAGKQVVLVDADFRRPKLHRVFNLSNTPGFSDVLSNGTPVSAVLQSTHIANLSLIPSGSNPDNPWKLLRSSRFSQVLDELKAQNDFVLLDSPSAMVFADAITMSAAVDGVIVVIRANQPPRGNELQLKYLLNKASANIIGLVLNAVSPQLTDSVCFHDYYYSSPECRKRQLAITGHQSEDTHRGKGPEET